MCQNLLMGVLPPHLFLRNNLITLNPTIGLIIRKDWNTIYVHIKFKQLKVKLKLRYDSNKSHVSRWSLHHDSHMINNLQHKNARKKNKEKLLKSGNRVIPAPSRKTIKYENSLRK